MSIVNKRQQTMEWQAFGGQPGQSRQPNSTSAASEREREREAPDGGADQKMVKSLCSTFLRDTVWLVKQFSVRARILTQKPDKSRTSMISVKGRLEVQAWAKDWTNNILPPCVNLPLIGNYGWMNVCLRIIMLGGNHNMLFGASFARCFPFDYLNDSHSRYNFIHIGYSVLASFVFSSPIGQIENQALFKLTVTLNTNCSSLESNRLSRKHFLTRQKIAM